MAMNPPAPDQFSGAHSDGNGFETARRDLLMGDSADERAAAAYKLGRLGTTAGAAYLIAALYDNAAEVRNAAAESLGLIGDATALGPLTDLQHREGKGSETATADAIRLITIRQQNSDPTTEHEAGIELELTSAFQDSVNHFETPQLRNQANVSTGIFSEAVAEIDALLQAQAEQTAGFADERDHPVVSNVAVDPKVQLREGSLRATINDEIEAGFELLSQTEARQSQLIAEAEGRLREHQETRHRIGVSFRQHAEQEQRLAEEIEALQLAEQELVKRIQEAEERRRAQYEAVRRIEVEMRGRAEEERLRLNELEEKRHHAEEETRKRLEQEQQLKLSIDLLARALTEQGDRIAEAEAKIAESLRKLRAAEQRHIADAEQAFKAQEGLRAQVAAETQQRSQKAERLAAEIQALQQRAEEQSERISKGEAEIVRAQASALAQSEAEARLREKVERLQQAEAEARLVAAAEANERVAADLRSQAEAEERRLTELAEIKQKAESAAQERAAREADLQRQLESLSQVEAEQVNRLRAGETSLQGKQQVLSQIEAELLRQSENLLQAEQEHRQRLLAAETSLQAKQEELLQLETELQQRSEEKEQRTRKIATLRKTLKKVEAEAQQRAAQEQQLTAQIAALRTAEANELNVTKKLEEDVQAVRSEAERLSAREGQLNAELYLLKTTLAAQQETHAALKARRLEQEKSVKEIEAATQVRADQEAARIGQLEATRQRLESEAQRRRENEQQLNLAIEKLRVDESEQQERLAVLRQHQATLEEAKRLRTQEESNLMAEVAALKTSIASAEESRRQLEIRQHSEAEERRAVLEAEQARRTSELEKRAAEEQQLALEIEALRQKEAEQLQRLRHAEVEQESRAEAATIAAARAAQIEAAIEIAEVVSEDLSGVESNVVEKAVTPSHAIVVESDSFSLELNPGRVGLEEEIVIDNTELAMPAVQGGEVEVTAFEPVSVNVGDQRDKSLLLVKGETGLTAVNQDSPLSEAAVRLQSADAAARCEALLDLSQIGGEEAFDLIAGMFDDASVQVRNAAARALCDLNSDRAASLTRALREAQPERRRRIGAAFAGSGLAAHAINCLAGESREVTYDAFTILFLMAKAGEVQPLIETIENHANIAVRLAVIKLLAFSNQADVVAAFRRLAVRASLPAEVRSAVMEAIHDIGSSRQPRISAA